VSGIVLLLVMGDLDLIKTMVLVIAL
jgi:hypothetical protein